MYIQEPSPKSKERDLTMPLLLTGIGFAVLFACLCVLVPWLMRDSLKQTVKAIQAVAKTPTSGPRPCPAIPTGWKEVFHEDFDSNANGWPNSPDDDPYRYSNINITDGVLRYSAIPHKGFYTLLEPRSGKDLKDFYLIATARQVDGPAGVDYGVIFRMDDWDHYYFGISTAGAIGIYQHSDGETTEEQWQTLYRSSSSFIHGRQDNELIVIGQGADFTFCINQQKLIQVESSTYTHGTFGFPTSSGEPDQRYTLEFDKFSVYAPK